MDILVRKYGGTSIGNPDRLRRAARSVAAAARNRPTVVVVSAQGDTTDRLLTLAEQAGHQHFGRETDQLLATGESASAALFAMAVEWAGSPAVSLTGDQAGVRVSGPAGAGVISAVDTTRIRQELARGRAVVVAGFQGSNDEGDVVTLGRGGSDTSAVALAAALGAPDCEIYTDVDGVYTADPRVVPTARPMRSVAMPAMVEMAFAGARVLHSRSVELAAAYGITVHVRNAARDTPGTVIDNREEAEMVEFGGVLAITHDLDVTRVLIRCDATGADPAVSVLEIFGKHNAVVDLVARSGQYETEFRMGFVMRRSDLERVRPDLDATVASCGGQVVLDAEVAKVSLIGIGLLNRPSLTARVLATLAAAGIATGWVSTSQLRTSVTVPRQAAEEAVALLHKEFELDEQEARPA
ncbi:aspartate kinase [Kutzneria sp. NPDC051319]|uniref:aspartate kinase n=1 Tax=Kutzneria sp. NPDC051319 TaxID=3155047 RepID=UPI00343E100F